MWLWQTAPFLLVHTAKGRLYKTARGHDAQDEFGSMGRLKSLSSTLDDKKKRITGSQGLHVTHSLHAHASTNEIFYSNAFFQ